MAQKKIRATRFVDATLKTTAPLTFIDEETGESVTDTFEIIYFALSPRKALELDEWVADFDRRIEALDARRRKHEESQAQARLTAVAEDLPFVDELFIDAETEGLQHALAQFVARLVSSIPEIVGDDEKPITITAATLSGMASQNLRAIRDAVLKDTATNPTPPAS